ncbi:MAG: RNA 2',3'-cyclic phosphodiesterase [Clostridiales bacterium]|nr:RNA 2',3'-cyclic phosphodiesterase [Clostridiales bacterium]
MRLFIAINLSDGMKDVLDETAAELRSVARRGRYTHRENLHLTLVFIGESDRVDDILDVMEDVAEEFFTEPIRLALSGAGAFRRSGGDLHWVGVESTPELKALAKALADGLRADGFDIERRRYVPHITIAREVVVGAGGGADGGGGAGGAAVKVHLATMEADHISIMRSDHIGGRLVYTEVASVPCGSLAYAKDPL